MYIAYREVGAGALAGCSSVQSLAPCTSLWVPRASLRLRRAALGCFSFHTRPTVRGCQGATRFDCQKSEKKSRKLKVWDGFFSTLVDLWVEWRVPPCSVELGGHSGVFKTEKEILFSKTGTEATDKKINGSIEGGSS